MKKSNQRLICCFAGLLLGIHFLLRNLQHLHGKQQIISYNPNSSKCPSGKLIPYANLFKQQQWLFSNETLSKISPESPVIFVHKRKLYNEISSNGCAYKCMFTTNKNEYHNSHLAIFTDTIFPKAIHGPKDILWGFESLESVIHSAKIPLKLQDRIRMVISTHRKSTVIRSYGRFAAFNKPECLISEDVQAKILTKDNRRWLPAHHSNRTKLVAWVVSNQKSPNRRKQIANTLSKYLKLEIYGNAHKSCQKGNDCFKWLSLDHKFYLAFENSNCMDYVTEKLFRNSLSSNMVPIVYGMSIENYKEVSPPHSFIHVNQFKSIKKLAEYISYLDVNDTAYAAYFAWKEYGKIEFESRTDCEICGRLHQHLRGEHLLPIGLYSHIFDQNKMCYVD